jgi:SAM-dependent methyltransferase
VTLRRILVAQFRRPSGPLGVLAGWVMARRSSNRARSLWSVELLDVRPGQRVLELGCGPGVALAALAQRAAGGKVIGLDHSPTVLRQARRRNARAIRAGRVELFEGSYLALPAGVAQGGPFDRILAVNSLQFADTPEPLLRSLREALRPGGRLAVTFQSRRSGASDADSRRGGEELARKLAAAGFRAVRTERLPLEPACAVCVIGERL